MRILAPGGVNFTKLFLPSKNLPAHGFRQKIALLLTNILPLTWTKFGTLSCKICELKFEEWLPNLCAVCQLPFSRKLLILFARKIFICTNYIFLHKCWWNGPVWWLKHKTKLMIEHWKTIKNFWFEKCRKNFFQFIYKCIDIFFKY